jgi:hypothetical protein
MGCTSSKTAQNHIVREQPPPAGKSHNVDRPHKPSEHIEFRRDDVMAMDHDHGELTH